MHFTDVEKIYNAVEVAANLDELLVHEDPRVAESALRCFATLTDRYIRKSLDPAELAESSSLVAHLLDSLLPDHTALPSSSAPSSVNDSAMGALLAPKHSTSFISIVLSLLSNLCRGSPKVTDAVLKYVSVYIQILPTFNSQIAALQRSCRRSNRRLVAETSAAFSTAFVSPIRSSFCFMRDETLLYAQMLRLPALAAAARRRRPQSPATSVRRRTAPTRKTHTQRCANAKQKSAAHHFEANYFQLIDVIRQRDTDALINAIESNGINPNFTDDVGQTLLNWCSAFGTIEMVGEFFLRLLQAAFVCNYCALGSLPLRCK